MTSTLVTERCALYTEGNLITKFCLYGTLIKRIRQINVCCRSYRFAMATKINTTSISIAVSVYLISFSNSNSRNLNKGHSSMLLYLVIPMMQVKNSL